MFLRDLTRQHRAIEDRIETANRPPSGETSARYDCGGSPVRPSHIVDGQFLPLATEVE